jgi:hypothetical protein
VNLIAQNNFAHKIFMLRLYFFFNQITASTSSSFQFRLYPRILKTKQEQERKPSRHPQMAYRVAENVGISVGSYHTTIS